MEYFWVNSENRVQFYSNAEKEKELSSLDRAVLLTYFDQVCRSLVTPAYTRIKFKNQTATLQNYKDVRFTCNNWINNEMCKFCYSAALFENEFRLARDIVEHTCILKTKQVTPMNRDKSL